MQAAVVPVDGDRAPACTAGVPVLVDVQRAGHVWVPVPHPAPVRRLVLLRAVVRPRVDVPSVPVRRKHAVQVLAIAVGPRARMRTPTLLTPQRPRLDVDIAYRGFGNLGSVNKTIDSDLVRLDTRGVFVRAQLDRSGDEADRDRHGPRVTPSTSACATVSNVASTASSLRGRPRRRLLLSAQTSTAL